MPRPDLIEHPEGGRYREIFRSIARVRTEGGDTRSALTHIYFSLAPGEVSRFHRVRSDEVWNLYEGPGLLLLLWEGNSATVQTTELSRRTGVYCQTVTANTWQAAEPLSGEVLAGCSVAPGFEFEDFELLSGNPSSAERLLHLRPDLARFVGVRP